MRRCWDVGGRQKEAWRSPTRDKLLLRCSRGCGVSFEKASKKDSDHIIRAFTYTVYLVRTSCTRNRATRGVTRGWASVGTPGGDQSGISGVCCFIIRGVSPLADKRVCCFVVSWCHVSFEMASASITITPTYLNNHTKQNTSRGP